jgi:hypothetical protein
MDSANIAGNSMTAVVDPARPRPEPGLAKTAGLDQPNHPVPVTEPRLE